MKQKTKYTAEQLAEIANHLKALPPVEKKPQEFSKQEAVKILSKEIAALQKRGYSLALISEALKGQGLDIATPTLKSYLQRAKPPAKTAKKLTETVSTQTSIQTIAVGKAQVSETAKNEMPEVAHSKMANSSFVPKPDTDDI